MKKLIALTLVIVLTLALGLAVFGCAVTNGPADEPDDNGQGGGDRNGGDNGDDNVVTRYTVTFNTLGGSAVSAQVVDGGSVAVRPANPTLSGHAFVDWFTQETGGAVYSFSTPVTQDTTIFARWNIVEPSFLNGVYRLMFDGIPIFVRIAADLAGRTAALAAPATTSAIRSLWDSTPRVPLVPVIIQLRLWWVAADVMLGQHLPGNLVFDPNVPQTEDEFFEMLEEAIAAALYEAAYNYVIEQWSPQSVYIILQDGHITFEGFGGSWGTDSFTGTFEFVDGVINPSWIDAVPSFDVGVIYYVDGVISIAVSPDMTLRFERVGDV